MTFTSATATPRLDTRVSRDRRRGPEGTEGHALQATPANPARRDPPMRAEGNGSRTPAWRSRGGR
jgi:hypothetical protein